MTAPFAPALAATQAPPVMEARRWLAAAELPEGLDLLNVSQAAPVAPPPPALREAMVAAIEEDPGTHLYGPVLGLPDLRSALASSMTHRYRGTVSEAQIGVTAGCNQAFAAAIATLAGPGDNVILPVPWYFNHQMWLQMSGIARRPLDTGHDLLPDPDAAAALIDRQTRAIVLVSPNNPTGMEYPADLLAAFRDLARARGIALILDETYRDFDGRDGAAHDLMSDPDWDDTVISLYSFSKAYRLTGHRVGAVATSPDRLAQVEKFLDTVQICAPQLGQRAALWGLQHLGEWLAGERAEILARRYAMEAAFQRLTDWELLGCGAYFGYARHRLDVPSNRLAENMVSDVGVLALPGTMFAPEGAARGQTEMRFAFANIDRDGVAKLAQRLASYRP